MSMMGTLAKVAIGMAVAKGAGSLMGGNQSGGGGLGGMLGGLMGGGQQGGGGGLGGMLGGLMGGGSGSSSNAMGQMASMLSGSGNAGGAMAGGLGGMLGMLGGGAGGASGGFGDMLNSALSGQNVEPEPSDEEKAEILLTAMINAQKSDGQIDAAEQEKLMKHLGELDQQEANFVRAAMAAPLDLDGFVASIPEGMENQVYFMSLMAIDLDNQKEAQYLHSLASALGLEQQAVNAIHDQIGAPKLYA